MTAIGRLLTYASPIGIPVSGLRAPEYGVSVGEEAGSGVVLGSAVLVGSGVTTGSVAVESVDMGADSLHAAHNKRTNTQSTKSIFFIGPHLNLCLFTACCRIIFYDANIILSAKYCQVLMIYNIFLVRILNALIYLTREENITIVSISFSVNLLKILR
jgi:hypothetical protein